MTKRETVLLVVIVLVLLGFVFLWFWRPASIPPPTGQQSVASKPAPVAATSWPVVTPMTEYPQLSLKNMPLDKAEKIYVERLKNDRNADWIIPLNFYGKVVDENNQPIEGAKVHYEWNVVGGTNFADTTSDGAGLFSLTGQHGKDLGVTVTKEGYYSVDRGGAEVSFEFADPGSSFWYEPDSKSPVIFHLRKKGLGAKLFSKSLIIPLNSNRLLGRVNLMQGFIKPDGVFTITADYTQFLPGNQPFPWTASLSMAEGGLVETNEQFPFMAPTSGYNSIINFAMTNMDRSVWQDGFKKTYYFYLPSTNTYGRMTVFSTSGLSVQLSYVYNLTPGNRVLEPASQ